MSNTENKASKPVEKPTAAKRVEITVPKGYANDDPNMIIGINGVNYVLPRGKKSMVPDFVAAEFYRSQAAQEKLDETVEQMLDASK